MRTGSARCASVSFSVVVSMVTAGVSLPNRSSMGVNYSGGLRGLYLLVAESRSRGLKETGAFVHDNAGQEI